jgi:hypothetical protein
MRVLIGRCAALGLAGAFLTVAAGPARADWDDYHHHRGHEEYHWRRPAYVAPYYPPRYYAPPPVYYPPPAYYAPPPVYYGAPGITFSFR